MTRQWYTPGSAFGTTTRATPRASNPGNLTKCVPWLAIERRAQQADQGPLGPVEPVRDRRQALHAVRRGPASFLSRPVAFPQAVRRKSEYCAVLARLVRNSRSRRERVLRARPAC